LTKGRHWRIFFVRQGHRMIMVFIETSIFTRRVKELMKKDIYALCLSKE
jgi:hypothetical protein